MRLSEHKYKTVSKITGQLIFLEGVHQARIGEVALVECDDRPVSEAEVLEINEGTVLLQVYGSTQGLSLSNTSVIFSDSLKTIPLSPDLLGRKFSGSFQPLDGLPQIIGEKRRPVTGFPINPAARLHPDQFIETGISAIDTLTTLVKGQKLPIFSGAGLPSRELVEMILKNARLGEQNSEFAIVFAALGLTHSEFTYYINALNAMETDYVAIINMADEPVMERLLAPRLALTISEYLAFELQKDVLTIITDITNYCDALREISTAREELPGRRGYPGYMYSDLAFMFERAGRFEGNHGSLTLIPILTMPEDDITHPIPDLTGYITEGQIVLSRQLHAHSITPPIDVLPSLSRLMQKGIGEGRTREDHRAVSNRLYRNYAMGCEHRKLEAIVGRDGMSDSEVNLLEFALAFEREFVNQGEARRSVGESLDIGLKLLERFKLK